MTRQSGRVACGEGKSSRAGSSASTSTLAATREAHYLNFMVLVAISIYLPGDARVQILGGIR